VVLGCTHYPFVKKAILDTLGPVPVFDSTQGTARQLHRRLEAAGLMAPAGQTGGVILRSSKNTPEELALYERLYKAKL
jgi:glutamate racemase